MQRPENIAARLGDNPMFAKDAAGELVTRERKCECGNAFTQRLLSQRFFNIVAKRGPGCLAHFERQIPGGYVPVHCLPCERRDLGRQARMDEQRPQPYHTERDEAAD